MFMMKNGHHERAHQLYTDCRTSLVEGPWLMKSSASPADIWLSGTLWSSPAETLDWGKKGGGNTEGAKKKYFGAIPYFLEIANVGEAYLICERISVLPKVFSANISPNRLKTLPVFSKSVFAKHFSKVFQKCFVAKHFCVLPYAYQLISHLYVPYCYIII